MLKDARDLLTPLPRSAAPVGWRISDAPVDYEAAVAWMEARAEAIAEGGAGELVWLLEHPPLYTAGAGARPEDLLDPDRFPVHRTGRGGQFTYHGPGQRVAYAMLDLGARGRDVRRYVAGLEEWLIRALARFNVRGERREDRVGVWVRRPERGTEDKIAAIGVRVRRWVTLHGIALNVDPDLGHVVSMAEADVALRAAFEEVFGPTAAEG